jgi:hypothetical protein
MVRDSSVCPGAETSFHNNFCLPTILTDLLYKHWHKFLVCLVYNMEKVGNHLVLLHMACLDVAFLSHSQGRVPERCIGTYIFIYVSNGKAMI